MLIHINFNDNDNSHVYDFSTNKNHAEIINALTIVAADVGFAGRFDGSTSYLNFGEVGEITTNELSIFLKLRKHTTGTHTVIFKESHYKIISKGDKIEFSVSLNGSWKTVASLTSLDNNVWYTIHCVYSSNNSDFDYLAIYINGVLDNKDDLTVDSNYVIDSASSSDLVFGASLSSEYEIFFDGDLEQVEVYDSEHLAAVVLAKHNSPIGIKYQTQKVHGLELADLITGKGTNKQMVVTYKGDTKIFYAIPIGDKLEFVDIILRIGNIYDTYRQYYASFKIVSDKPVLQLKQGVSTFMGIIPGDNLLEIGLSNLSQEGKLHLKIADSGGIAHPNNNNLVIENNDHCGISILSPNNKIGGLVFADSDANDVCAIEYGHSVNKFLITVNAVSSFVIDQNQNIGIGIGAGNPSERLHIVGNEKIVGKSQSPNVGIILGAGDTTFAITRNTHTITGNVKTNTITTITGGLDGQTLTLLFVDALITITDNNIHDADTVDLSGAFTSEDDMTLTLIYIERAWYETSRSRN